LSKGKRATTNCRPEDYVARGRGGKEAVITEGGESWLCVHPEETSAWTQKKNQKVISTMLLQIETSLGEGVWGEEVNTYGTISTSTEFAKGIRSGCCWRIRNSNSTGSPRGLDKGGPEKKEVREKVRYLGYLEIKGRERVGSTDGMQRRKWRGALITRKGRKFKEKRAKKKKSPREINCRR